jgi:hypothetical protein
MKKGGHIAIIVVLAVVVVAGLVVLAYKAKAAGGTNKLFSQLFKTPPAVKQPAGQLPPVQYPLPPQQRPPQQQQQYYYPPMQPGYNPGPNPYQQQGYQQMGQNIQNAAIITATGSFLTNLMGNIFGSADDGDYGGGDYSTNDDYGQGSIDDYQWDNSNEWDAGYYADDWGGLGTGGDYGSGADQLRGL